MRVPPRPGGLGSMALLLLVSGCNVLFGFDESSLPPQDAAGSGGQAAAGVAGQSGEAGRSGGAGQSGGNAGEGGGQNDKCDEAPNCTLCCLNQVTNATFAVAVGRFFEVCLCEPARDRDGSAGNGKCEKVVPGCEQCCTRLCDEGEPSAVDLADCAGCAAQQGGDQCESPRGFCQENFGDIVCSEYFDCEAQYECRKNE